MYSVLYSPTVWGSDLILATTEKGTVHTLFANAAPVKANPAQKVLFAELGAATTHVPSQWLGIDDPWSWDSAEITYAIELGVAPQWCDNCQCETVLDYSTSSGRTVWFLPCCHVVCKGCDVPGPIYETCSNCECCWDGCCECVCCDHCGDYEDDCGGGSASSAVFSDPVPSDRLDERFVVPGWIVRGDALPEEAPQVSVKADVLKPDYSVISPVEMMADFYISEFVAYHAGNTLIRQNGKTVLKLQPGSDRRALVRKARALQDFIVGRLDPVFRDYGLAACAGEVRYHRNVIGTPSSRGAMWDWGYALAESIGRAQFLTDVTELFGDRALWPVNANGNSDAGVGGKAWEVCAEIVRQRESGELDARTFVDRCFSLQHNGGSFLNKVSWAGESVSYCYAVGNAHDALIPDLSALLRCASADGAGLLLTLWGSSFMDKGSDDYGALEYALEHRGYLRHGLASPWQAQGDLVPLSVWLEQDHDWQALYLASGVLPIGPTVAEWVQS